MSAGSRVWLPIRPLGKSLTVVGEGDEARGLGLSEASRWRSASRVMRLDSLHSR
jgi:hypothetical protein